MKTIAERAKEVGTLSQLRSDYPYDKRSIMVGYIRGATDQKDIDDAELSKLKSVWGNETQVNRRCYIKGYQDAVDKACKWFGDYLFDIGYPDDWMRDSPNLKSGEAKFRKAMEE